MSFKYDLTANQQTPTSGSKVVLCKSFKIDIAAGSGFLSGTSYQLGWLPKDAQAIEVKLYIPTSVSGGTVSAATIAISISGQNLINGANVFGTGAAQASSSQYYGASGFVSTTVDQTITYTPTLTGSGATAGIMFVNVFYVV